jgi:hypothetical protein
MRSRTVSDASAHVPIRSERKIEEPRPATRRDYYEAAATTFLALAASGQEHDPSREGPLGCQIELLEEFLDVVAQVPNVTMPKRQ